MRNKSISIKLFIPVTLFFLVSVAGIFVYLNYQHKICEQDLLTTERKIETLERINGNFRNMILNNLSSESSAINPDIVLINAITNNKTSIGEIAKNSPVLILRFTEYSCHACIEESFLVIKNLQYSFAEGKFIIIASYESIRDLLLFKKENNINQPIYTLSNDSIKIPLEALNFPYFFILTTNYEATTIFYPLVSSPELTKDYFSILRYKFPILFSSPTTGISRKDR